jgi:hypothetical protein
MADVTLTAVHLDFKCHKDGKDANTVMTIKITNGGIRVAGPHSLTGVAIGNDEDKPVDFPASEISSVPFSATDAIKGGSLIIDFEPVGDDTMHYDLGVDLTFSDSSGVSYTFQEQTLSENPGNKIIVYSLAHPDGG